ncbi:putative virion structural protein [Pseudomonas phage OBP]|uniref:putative virion structural protein n=1 Tax=Pseudomonas phage OBP TaxID=1124849 RepID=UPI000240D437|nr:putative virion structural protein [Pseudomonas phage OBP]AEV89526.1 putative virion structural protein [Pseudomonas phage OBP]
MSWELEHFATMVSGCESINTHLAKGTGLSADGEYAFTVLKLHASDAGFVAGTEGFLDNVKKGAKKGKEWFIAFFKALKDFFKQGFRNVISNLGKLKGGDKKHAAKTAATSLSQLEAAINVLEIVSDRDAGLDTGYYREMLAFKNDVIHASQLSKKANEHDVDRLIKLVEDALSKGQRLSDRMATDWERNVEKADADEHQRKYYMELGRAGVDVGRALSFVTSAAQVWSRELRDAGVKE